MNLDPIFADVAPQRARWTLWLSLCVVVILVGWASVARIDQVTRVQGQMIATARTQEVQSPDGGRITQLLVKEGDQVKKGQLLAVLEKERALAALDDSQHKIAALRISLNRMHAEMSGQALVFDKELLPYREFIDNQTELYQHRRQSVEMDIAALKKMRRLAQEELTLNEPLLAQGDVSRVDIIRLQRQVADLDAQILSRQNRYLQETQTQMTETQEKLSSEQEQLRDRSQVLEHTDMTSPVNGMVKNIRMHTIGGVIKGGETLIEILPTDVDQVTEVKVSPADIASVKLGQHASVKLDAYDYTIFGSLQGTVSYISPDTLVEETRNGPMPFYRVHVRIDLHSPREGRNKDIQIVPGMTAMVEIKSQDRTVLSYLTKPITKTLNQSLGER
ncbi:HlyD family efflux transporter periplasmic adaptor subunit [Agitococcus lubricus]|uniref:Adhesin transport system membrane fusion protein n=1 Tax=Agitococcus lubricus TaxID=1077255 RepID=A0A2T5J3Y3_9GAMM|nr:HlyD family efflux transporter periplasmic adaptor subunit [Agitococcus lubricus]PTQ91325.1 adhesin transport system membrane fusion protein [Agitococcus lubricus]